MKQFILLAGVVLAVGLFYLSTIREGHNWGGDFSMYIHHAKNIIEGKDYADTGYIFNPHPACGVGPRTYPPVFPFLLSPVYKWFGSNMKAMKTEIVLFFLASLFVIYAVFRDELPLRYLTALTAVIGFNPYFWQFKDQVLSDVPFMFFTFLSIYLIKKVYQTQQKCWLQALYSTAVGISIYLSYGTRSIGAVIVPSLFVYDVLRFRRPTQSTVIASLLFGVLMVLQNIFFHNDSSYVAGVHISALTVLSQVSYYIKTLAGIWNNGYSLIAKTLLFLIASGLAVAGYVARVKDRVSFFEIFSFLYMAILILFPARQGLRYVIPLIPFYIFYVFKGLGSLRFLKRRGLEKLVLTVFTATVCLSYVADYTKMDFGPIREGIAKKESVELFNYIKEKTDEKDIFIFTKPRTLSLFTGRRTSTYQMAHRDEVLLAYFQKIKVDYVIVGEVFRRDLKYLKPFVNRNRENFQEVYCNPDFRVYKLKGASGPKSM